MRASNPGKTNLLLTIRETGGPLRWPYAIVAMAVFALGSWALVIAGVWALL